MFCSSGILMLAWLFGLIETKWNLMWKMPLNFLWKHENSQIDTHRLKVLLSRQRTPKYLGVAITNNFNWGNHITTIISNEANRTLGMVQRSLFGAMGNCNDYSPMLLCGTPKNSPCLLVGGDSTATCARKREKSRGYDAQCFSFCLIPWPFHLVSQHSLTCFCSYLQIIFLLWWMARARGLKDWTD